MFDIDDFFINNGHKLSWAIDIYYYITGIFFLVIILNLLLSILFDSYDKVDFFKFFFKLLLI